MDYPEEGYDYYDNDPIFSGKCIVDRLIVTQISPDTFHATIWSNILNDMTEPEDGKRYLKRDCYDSEIAPASIIEFDFTSVESADADFEIFVPHLNKLILCLELDHVVKMIEDDIRAKFASVKITKHKKKGRKAQKDVKVKELIETTIPEYRKWILSEFRMAHRVADRKLYLSFAKIMSLAIIQLVAVPKMPIVETKENPHMSRKKKA